MCCNAGVERSKIGSNRSGRPILDPEKVGSGKVLVGSPGNGERQLGRRDMIECCLYNILDSCKYQKQQYMPV